MNLCIVFSCVVKTVKGSQNRSLFISPWRRDLQGFTGIFYCSVYSLYFRDVTREIAARQRLICFIFRKLVTGMVRYAKTQLSVSCLTIKFVSCFIVDRVVFFGKISCFLREFLSLIFDFLRPFESLFRFILVKIPWNTLF